MSASIDIPVSEAPPSYNHVFGNAQYTYADGSPIHYFERSLDEDAESEMSLESGSPYAVGPGVQRYTTALSSSIPFQLPYNDENHENTNITNMKDTSRRGSSTTATRQASVCSTWLESMGHSFPDNITRIESNEIVSPIVASVESRFQIPLTKLHDSHKKQLATKARRSYSMSASSSSSHHYPHHSNTTNNNGMFKNLLFHRRDSHATIVEGKEFNGKEDASQNGKLLFDEKYEYTGNVLGEGSGGSVKVVKRKKDNVMFAVKAFHPYEETLSKDRDEENYTVQSYLKKIKAEYCISSILQHCNIISTVEIIEQDEHTLLQVMEYVEYDLFAIVMSEQLHYSEACCYFWQLLQGVLYLHDIGLAHRDLKLDNLVVNNKGKLKIIDFGAAVVYKSPYTDNGNNNGNNSNNNDSSGSTAITMAKGIVGSDPYLSPELYIFETYDPRATDIWAIGIIFVCMILRSFPWKYPRLKDSGFRRFCLCRRGANTLNELVTRDNSIPEDDMIIQYDDADEDNDEGNHIAGPMRLLAPLPEETHHILLQILDPSPIRRPSIDMILLDNWVCSIDYCQDKLHPSKDHEHTRLDPTKAHIANLRPSSD